MSTRNIEELLASQRAYFRSGATLSYEFRRDMLNKLMGAIKAHEKDIEKALYEDLGKSDFEGFMCEIGLVKTELSHMSKNLRKYMAEKTVVTPLPQFASRSFQKPSPYGNVLIMSPWNYPFLLTMDPLVCAIAAGDTAIIKPSAYSPATSAVVKTIIEECFPPEYIAVVLGGRAENAALLDQKFDLIFFTGSTNVGKEVLRHAAEYFNSSHFSAWWKEPMYCG